MSETNPFPSNLDFSQVIQQAYNEDLQRLRVDAEISASIIAPPGLEVAISATDDNIAIRNSNNSNELLINSNGSINIEAATLPLPNGASTEAKQDFAIAILAHIDGNILYCDTNSVQIAASVLPTGAATSALQIAGNASLVSIDSKLTSPLTVSVNNFPATQAVTQSTSPWVSNISQFGGNNVITGTGASGLGIPRVTVSNDSNILATQSGIWTVVDSKVPQSSASPTSISVGIISTLLVASNSSRTGLVLVNTSNQTISLGIGTSAVLNSGITLLKKGGTWVMDQFTFTTGAINGIAGAAGSNISIQEFS